jgi:DEAD/DEAH box helicase domain-containing protein
VRRWPPRAAKYADFPNSLNAALREILIQRGITRLYSHQAESWDRLESGANAVIVTATASGKTLCYNLPVLNRFLSATGGRALYLFPTKALAEDQVEELHRLTEASGSATCAFTYDGDTPQDARRAIRQRANIVLTNPDMLHSGILPQHAKWRICLRIFVTSSSMNFTTIAQSLGCRVSGLHRAGR